MGYLDDAFGAGGHLARHLPGYAPRAGQRVYAGAVDAVLVGGGCLLVEAGTGVGKSLGYGVPIATRMAERGKTGLIVTANIALQEQLIKKDLPLLAAALPRRFTFAMIKGRGNYLCLRKLQDVKDRLSLLLSGDDLEQAQAILTWSTATEDGDVSGLPFEPAWRVWGEFSSNSDDCAGQHCPCAPDCFGQRARAALEGVNVLVANYHLLYAHLKVREAVGANIVLPAFDAVVLDEAHRGAEIARDFLGFSVSYSAVSRIARRAHGKQEAALERAAGVFFAKLADLVRSGRYKVRFREQLDLPWKPMCQALSEAGEALVAMAKGAEQVEAYNLKKHARRAGEIADEVAQAMCLSDPDTAYFAEERGKQIVLRSRPANVAPWLAEHLFGRTPAVVATSATLSDGAGDFGFAARELGVESFRELGVESPFDWSRQALLILPPMPDPREAGFADAVADELIEVVRQAGGRTLALFTSYRVLEVAHARLLAAGLPYRIMRQGDKPRTVLIDEFKEDEQSVLLGAESFWGGVDVPGNALRCLVIDKLPFPNPADPVIDLICARSSNWFFEESVPRAVTALRQGVGRLIRAVDDYGVVVLLDSRLTSKGYGKQLLRALPRMVKTRDVGVIGRFLADRAADATPRAAAQ